MFRSVPRALRSALGALVLTALLPLAASAQTPIHTEVAGLDLPEALAHNGSGVVFVATTGRIARLNDFGEPTTVAGDGVAGFAGDGGPALSARVGQVGAMVAVGGWIYFTDTTNHRVRLVDPDGMIRTFAGNGSAVDSGDGGAALAAGLPSPHGLAFDGNGNLYVSSGHRIRRIDRDGNIHAYTGGMSAGFSDGGGVLAEARFTSPGALGYNTSASYLAVADRGNRRLRAIYDNGTVHTIFGNGEDFDPADESASWNRGLGVPGGFEISSGDFRIALPEQHLVVYMATTSPSAFVLAGNGVAGSAGDGDAATAANLDSPASAVVGSNGLYIADTGNGRVRRVGNPKVLPAVPPAPTEFWPGNGAIVVALPSWPEPPGFNLTMTGVQLRATWSGGSEIRDVNYPNASFDGLQNGTYYTFAVRAIYSRGIGEWSPESVPVRPLNPHLASIADASVVEGDAGDTQLVFDVTLPAALTMAMTFYVRTEEGTADNPVDFAGVYQQELRFEAGETSRTFAVAVHGDAVPEENETLTVRVFNCCGVEMDSATGTILDDDDGAPEPTHWGVEDRFELEENAAETALDVLPNDHVQGGIDDLAGGSFAIVVPPAHGTARIVSSNPDYVDDDQLLYTPPANWVGEDSLAYRVCDVDGVCYQSVATVRVRFSYVAWIAGAGQSSRANVSVGKPRALSQAWFDATPIVSVQPETIVIPADQMLSSAFDALGGGTTTRLYTLPSSGTAAQWQVVAWIGLFDAYRFHLYVGVDDDGDGQASVDEVRCVSANSSASTFQEQCDIPVDHPGTGVVRYWVRVHNPRSYAGDVDLAVAAIPMAGDSRLVATGPASVPAGTPFEYTVSYDDPSILQSDMAFGVVQVRSGPGGAEVDRVPVRISTDGAANTNSAAALENGAPYALRLDPAGVHDRLYVDVPANATSLTVTAFADADVQLYLAPGAPAPAAASVASAPPREQAAASATGPGMERTLTVSGTQLTPGRWYVTPVNAGAEPMELLVTATIATGATPVVRPGSYFNAARSGHGVFLYPAGDEWAALWYTYQPGGRTTWYYGQGPKPGADGIWRGGLYHSSWDGDSNRLTRVGRLTVTPTGPDAFRLTHQIHGVTGSEPMASLGRGCPTLGGMPVDASSHWFNPATAGTGFSVQLWEDYEYYAAFVYDALGEARFLTAESASFAGADAVLALDQLHGFGPTSTYPGTPARATVGTLRRIVSGNTLARIQLSATYVDGVPGTWTSDDPVQILGGPGTTQGCTP